MKAPRHQIERLLEENRELRMQLREARETLDAIQSGEVDALVVRGPLGERIFSLQGVDHTYRVLIEAMREGAVTLSEDGSILYANLFMENLLDLPLEKLVATPFESRVHPDHLGDYEALVAREEAAHAAGELLLVGGTGTRIPVYLSVTRVMLEDIPIRCLTITDLREQKRREEILAEERLSRSIIDQAGNAIIVCDDRGVIIRASGIARDLVGKNCLRAHFDDLFHLRIPPEEPRHDAPTPLFDRFAIQQVIGGRRFVSCEASMGGDDGPERFFLLNAAPMRDHAGRVIGGIVNLTDITRERAARAALRASTERFQKVYDSQLDAIFVLDSDIPPRIVECNKAAERIFGYDAGEMIRASTDILHVSARRLRAFQIHLSDAFKRDGVLKNFRFAMKRRDGRVFPSEHTVLELTDEAGDRTGWVSVVRDMTEHDQMEQRLRQAQKMESIGSLAGGIAHDFNNILTPIVGMAEMLMEDLPAGGLEQGSAREILAAGQRGSDLVKQILAFSRRSERKKLPIRLQQVVKEALKLCRSTIPSNIEIVREIQEKCGLVLADPTQVHQIIMNLVTNAYHAVDAANGRISVSLRQTRLDGDKGPSRVLPPGSYAALTVSDTGCGIDPAIMDHIFDPYFTTKEQGRGTGLGLAVVFGIVQDHGGDIRIASRPGQGTTFTVYLPVMERTAAGARDPEGDAPSGGSERILLVDDEPTVARLEEKMLTRMGYQVTARLASPEALDTFRRDPEAWDLVITDMSMPEMTGVQLARELRALKPAVKVILCTGYSDKITPETAAGMGIQAMLLKPIRKNDFTRTVRQVLDQPAPVE